MKTYRNLYGQIVSFENLYLAFRKARKGKRGLPTLTQRNAEMQRNAERGRERQGSRQWRTGLACQAHRAIHRHRGMKFHARTIGEPIHQVSEKCRPAEIPLPRAGNERRVGRGNGGHLYLARGNLVRVGEPLAVVVLGLGVADDAIDQF